MPASREPDRWNEVGQDTWPPSLDERLYDADMVPGGDERLCSTSVHIDVCPECGEATTYHPLDPPMACTHDRERFVPVRYVPGGKDAA